MVSVTALAGVPGFVRDAFGDRVLRQANQAASLDIEAIEDEECFIPHITLAHFIHAIAKLSGEEHFGLLLSPYLSIATKGSWGKYMLGAPTLGQAIERGIATIGFHSKGDALSITSGNGKVRLSYASPTKSMAGYAHIACATAGILLSVCRAFLSDSWRPRRVELDIPLPRRLNVFEDTFQCPVVFNAPHVSVCLEAHLLNSPSLRPGLHSLITVEDLARARIDLRKLDTVRDIITQQIWSQVLSGRVSIESAAQSLDTSVRTLQRELNREGTSFRALANTMRAKRAMELLLPANASITTIAMSLGYSAPAHFARAFRKATGMSPQEFRQNNFPMVSP